MNAVAGTSTTEETWLLAMTTPSGVREAVLKLARTESSLMGRWIGSRSDAAISAGRIDGDRVEWTVEVAGRRGAMLWRFHGVIADDTISGVARLGQAATTTFTACKNVP